MMDGDRLELKTIKVLCSWGWERVWALSDGVLAIHRSIGFPGEFWMPGWTLTHVGTGCAVAAYNDKPGGHTKEEVLAAYKRWRHHEYRGRELFSLAACELVELVPDAARLRGKDEDDISYWQRWYQPKIAAALRCGQPE
jgi:hypothetical protein